MKVLFLCVANSARSQMAEGLARTKGGYFEVVESAGSSPSGFVRPLAVEAMKEVGVDISKNTSKSIEVFDLDAFDAIVTLCAEEVCPLAPPEKRLDWSTPDPAVDVEGETEEQKLQRFRVARDEIERKMDAHIASNPKQ
ncbi:phosphotyrosine protein phosphatase [Chloropicon primus]|uniref:Phosphotyrosine protein phosphatase n=1 Tax=Chloropicon primus TaxID=1764295 RepID=A0A5B8MC79_9CHLO|nr:phosphotyrosine protein phosphatase [Chloropicon primus]UPQ97289.1 phosphotyrosine protein phosphatase [Chloropicon primus]|mmetsp:Transcript_9903/g.28153  ORF Transcript_9903/g.28153 Transcript_9903/m.28153 type:complete len:139 (-) Transcript_9903:2104-2520(-)|eukprot:QDZ18076.1 phosphotyrosine protein phosphatase [Chloropicon primus]